MGRANKKELQKREDQAFELLCSGHGNSSAASVLTDRLGVSRKTALRAVHRANLRMVSDLDLLDRQHLLSQLIHVSQESIRGAMRTKNYGAALAGIKLLHSMVIEPAQPPKSRSWIKHY